MPNKLSIEELKEGNMVVEIEGKAKTLAAMIASAMDSSEDLAQVFKMAVLAYLADKMNINLDKKEESFLTEMYRRNKEKSNLN